MEFLLFTLHIDSIRGDTTDKIYGQCCINGIGELSYRRRRQAGKNWIWAYQLYLSHVSE